VDGITERVRAMSNDDDDGKLVTLEYRGYSLLTTHPNGWSFQTRVYNDRGEILWITYGRSEDETEREAKEYVDEIIQEGKL
jgi:hypothetical protein